MTDKEKPRFSEDFIKNSLDEAKFGRVPIYGEFDQNLENLVIKCILIASRSEKLETPGWCTLFIDSKGGSIPSQLRILSTMKESKLKFKGYVVYKAISSGFNLLQNCDWREGNPYSQYLFHYGDRGYNLNNHQQALLLEGNFDRIKLINEENRVRLEETSQRTKLTVTELHELAKKDKYLTASEALEFGFIDEISISLPSVSTIPPSRE
jgi:ATP-dependent protease ClpP protease subunit